MTFIDSDDEILNGLGDSDDENEEAFNDDDDDDEINMS